jgi:hypothetical protein
LSFRCERLTVDCASKTLWVERVTWGTLRIVTVSCANRKEYTRTGNARRSRPPRAPLGNGVNQRDGDAPKWIVSGFPNIPLGGTAGPGSFRLDGVYRHVLCALEDQPYLVEIPAPKIMVSDQEVNSARVAPVHRSAIVGIDLQQ